MDNIRTQCSNCNTIYTVPKSAVGKSTNCKACEQPFVITEYHLPRAPVGNHAMVPADQRGQIAAVERNEPPPPPTKTFIIHHNDKDHGPYNHVQLRQIAASGKVTLATPVRLSSSQQWHTLADIKGLEIVPAPVAPPPPSGSTRRCPICDEQIALQARKCKHCGEYLDGRQPQQQPQVVVTQNVGGYVAPHPRWNSGVAALLSFLLPGLGQLYKGQVLNGIVWMFVVIIGYMFFIIPGLILHICCIAGAASGDPYR